MGLLKALRTWLKVPTYFSAADFRGRDRFRPDYRLLASAILEKLDFQTFVDVGCANGFLLEALLEAGKAGSGIEISQEARDVLPPELQSKVQIGDFSEVRGTFDLVCCVEVAEHIEPHRTDDLVATLARAATQWIYFTAAPPGQRGHGHINCRPREDWIGRFEKLGWAEAEDVTERMREHLDGLAVAHWLRENTMVLHPMEPRRIP